MKHLTLFNTEADYNSSELSLPNVSYIVESNVVKYHPFDPLAQPIYINVSDGETTYTYPDVYDKLRVFENYMIYDYLPDYVKNTYGENLSDIMIDMHWVETVVTPHNGSNAGDVEVSFSFSAYDNNINDWTDGYIESLKFNVLDTHEDYIKYASNIYVQNPDGEGHLPVLSVGFDAEQITCPKLYITENHRTRVRLLWGEAVWE